MVGVAKRNGICSVLQAELWVAYLEMTLAWDSGYRRVLVEIDSDLALSFSQILINIILVSMPLYSSVGSSFKGIRRFKSYRCIARLIWSRTVLLLESSVEEICMNR